MENDWSTIIPGKMPHLHLVWQCHVFVLIMCKYAVFLYTLVAGLPDRLTNCILLAVHCCLWIVCFHQKCKFPNQIQKHVFDCSFKPWGTLGIKLIIFFLSKSISLLLPCHIAPPPPPPLKAITNVIPDLCASHIHLLYFGKCYAICILNWKKNGSERDTGNFFHTDGTSNSRVDYVVAMRKLSKSIKIPL